jgi:hypothetical protein
MSIARKVVQGLILVVLGGLVVAAKEDKGLPKYDSPYPPQSGVAISRTLEQDAIKSLKLFLKKQYGKAEFEILARRTIGEMKFAVDGKGRLILGQLHEVWTIRRAGAKLDLEFIMVPDGKGGNTVGFREYHENKPDQPPEATTPSSRGSP